MKTLNLSHTNFSSSGDDAGRSSGSPYSAVEIVLIVLVAATVSVITVIGNILVMLSIKVRTFCFYDSNHLRFKMYPPKHLEKYTRTIRHVQPCTER